MRRVLLVTTAAAALGVFSAPASAQLTVKLGGIVNFEAGFWDSDVEGETGREFRNATEVHVNADGKADNGLLYGVRIEVDSFNDAPSMGTSLNYDEANLYVAGNWGRIELGDQDGASDQLVVYSPLIGLGQVDGDYAYFLGSLAGVTVYAPDSGDSTKATYLTPTLAGFRAGISYAPETNGGDSVVRNEPTDGSYSDWIEAGVNYSGEFSGFTVALGASYTQAEGNDLVDGDPPVTTAGEDFRAWQMGAQLGYGGFAVGGSYVDMEDLALKNSWNAGISYATGPLGLGVSYYSHEGEAGVEDLDLIALGVAYTLAPGLVVQADYHKYEFSDGGDEGDIVIFSTVVAF
jgi:outer membrane protein OmpU